MARLYAQGDVLIEEVVDRSPSGTPIEPAADGAIVLAEGEVTGHRHTMRDSVTFFRDDALARDIPTELYIGHVKVEAPMSRVEHQEHAPINLPRGTYRVRRQRELQPKDVRLVAD